MGLDEYRSKINDIDKELMQLFERRMELVTEIAQYKKENNLPIYHKDREDEVIAKNVAMVENEELKDFAKDFLNSLMAVSRAYQRVKIKDEKSYNVNLVNIDNKNRFNSNITVGFPGVEGSFTETALIKYCGTECKKLNFEDFEDVFINLKEGKIDYGIVPIENSSTGAITETYDLLRKYGFYIVGEQCIRINQNLLGIKGATLEEIDEVYSHPQGFEQSTEFLKQYPHWKRIPYHNTAIAAQMVRDLKDKTKAAIASDRAAEKYKLEILKGNINNCSNNHTRFIIIGKNLENAKDFNKLSVIFAIEDGVGALYNVLRYFSENNINMVKIESRPIREKEWKYFFYVDFEGNLEQDAVNEALQLIDENSKYFRLLGAYKKFV